jgi:hypothetical protein
MIDLERLVGATDTLKVVDVDEGRWPFGPE